MDKFESKNEPAAAKEEGGRRSEQEERAQRIARLKRLVRSGEYRVDSADLARVMAPYFDNLL